MLDPLTTLVVVGTIMGTLSLDVGLNTLQNYYDAFWESAGRDPAVEKRLNEEEPEIERIFQQTNFQAQE